MEECIKWGALEAVEEPLNDGEETVDEDGNIDQFPERLCRKAEVKEQKRHLDDPVHQDIVDFFNEEGLHSQLMSSDRGEDIYSRELGHPFRMSSKNLSGMAMKR